MPLFFGLALFSGNAPGALPEDLVKSKALIAEKLKAARNERHPTRRTSSNRYIKGIPILEIAMDVLAHAENNEFQQKLARRLIAQLDHDRVGGLSAYGAALFSYKLHYYLSYTNAHFASDAEMVAATQALLESLTPTAACLERFEASYALLIRLTDAVDTLTYENATPSVDRLKAALHAEFRKLHLAQFEGLETSQRAFVDAISPIEFAIDTIGGYRFFGHPPEIIPTDVLMSTLFDAFDFSNLSQRTEFEAVKTRLNRAALRVEAHVRECNEQVRREEEIGFAPGVGAFIEAQRRAWLRSQQVRVKVLWCNGLEIPIPEEFKREEEETLAEEDRLRFAWHNDLEPLHAECFRLYRKLPADSPRLELCSARMHLAAVRVLGLNSTQALANYHQALGALQEHMAAQSQLDREQADEVLREYRDSKTPGTLTRLAALVGGGAMIGGTAWWAARRAHCQSAFAKLSPDPDAIDSGDSEPFAVYYRNLQLNVADQNHHLKQQVADAVRGFVPKPLHVFLEKTYLGKPKSQPIPGLKEVVEEDQTRWVVSQNGSFRFPLEPSNDVDSPLLEIDSSGRRFVVSRAMLYRVIQDQLPRGASVDSFKGAWDETAIRPFVQRSGTKVEIFLAGGRIYVCFDVISQTTHFAFVDPQLKERAIVLNSEVLSRAELLPERAIARALRQEAFQRRRERDDEIRSWLEGAE